MAQIIDGKNISLLIREEIAEEVLRLLPGERQPCLCVILVGEDPASAVYVRSKAKACKKAGIISKTIRLPHDIDQHSLEQQIEILNNDPEINGILVQLPLPAQIDEQEIIERIAPDKDVDGFHPVNVGRLSLGMADTFVPCTPAGIIEILERSGHQTAGKHVVIVGRSNIVGKPVGFLMLRHGLQGDATVTICHSRTKNLSEITSQADILIAAVGRAEMITADMVKPGAVVIDVGINHIKDDSRKSGYRLAGDVDFGPVSQIAGAITPVPRGVGPMTIAMLLKNTLIAYKKQNKKE